MARNLERMYGNAMIKKWLLLLVIPFFFACTKKEKIHTEKPTVLVTIAPYAEFTKRIGGDYLEVEILVPPGVNLHIYEPSPKHVEEVTGAAVWFKIDEPFEKKIAQAIQERNPKQKMVSLQAGLTLRGDDAIELSPCMGHHHDRDLHTWLSPKFALKQAQTIAETLITLFPEYGDVFRKNFNALSFDLQKLDKEITRKLEPFKGNALLVSHPAFGYFCQDYGLLQLSVECEGKDPRPKDVEEVMKKAKAYTVRCVLLQQGFNNRGASLIGKKLQLPIYRVDPYARDYLTNMDQIAEYITK